MGLVAVVTVLVFSVITAEASECRTRFGGACLNSLLSCPSGYHVSFSYCGFMQVCCFRGGSTSTSTGSGSGSSGQTSTGTHNTGSGSSGTSTGTHASGGSGTGTSTSHQTSGSSQTATARTHASGGSGTGTSTSHQTSGSSQTATAPQCGISAVNSDAKIVGGTTALAHEFPWQVSLMYNGQHMCGGTLIDNQWVISAAHCFENTYKDLWRVALGVHDNHLIYRTNYLAVTHIYVHSNFNADGRNNNDIAIVQLEKPVDTTTTEVRAACLPDANEDFDNQMCTVTGWGSSVEDGQSKRYLHKVSLPILTNDVCNYYLGRGVVGTQTLCAGYLQGGKDACQGDSGGPLVCKGSNGRWKLVGIVSYGYGCAQRYAPGVYTRVSAFLDWIKSAKSH